MQTRFGMVIANAFVKGCLDRNREYLDELAEAMDWQEPVCPRYELIRSVAEAVGWGFGGEQGPGFDGIVDGALRDIGERLKLAAGGAKGEA